ncbi:MAG: antitoxin [Candidatus Lokiarchaeota archaeon]|nr:antitoxin [Candidatus Lokiarchaeota archaeon]
MASKNISVRLGVYEKLKKLKQKGESFSDVIERILNEGSKGSTSRLMKYFGVWSDFPEEFAQKVEEFRKSMNDNIDERVKEGLNDISRQ